MTLPDVRRNARLVVGVLAAVVTGAAATTGPAVAAEPTGQIRYADSPAAIAGSYIVALTDGAVGARAGTARAATAVPARATDLTARYGGSVTRVYGAALNGFAAKLTAGQARRLAANPAVAYVEQDQVMSISATQANPRPGAWTGSTSGTCR
ncbi:hypothetical protein GCM10027605_50340 [Micromonospora zhanjiangensis]